MWSIVDIIKQNEENFQIAKNRYDFHHWLFKMASRLDDRSYIMDYKRESEHRDLSIERFFAQGYKLGYQTACENFKSKMDNKANRELYYKIMEKDSGREKQATKAAQTNAKQAPAETAKQILKSRIAERDAEAAETEAPARKNKRAPTILESYLSINEKKAQKKTAKTVEENPNPRMF